MAQLIMRKNRVSLAILLGMLLSFGLLYGWLRAPADAVTAKAAASDAKGNWQWSFPESEPPRENSLEDLRARLATNSAAKRSAVDSQQEAITKLFPEMRRALEQSDQLKGLDPELRKMMIETQLRSFREQPALIQKALADAMRAYGDLPSLLRDSVLATNSMVNRTGMSISGSKVSISMALAGADIDEITRAVLRETSWALDLYLDEMNQASMTEAGRATLVELRKARRDLMQEEMVRLIAPSSVQGQSPEKTQTDRVREVMSEVNDFPPEIRATIQAGLTSLETKFGSPALKEKLKRVSDLESKLAGLGGGGVNAARDPAEIDPKMILSALPNDTAFVQFVSFQKVIDESMQRQAEATAADLRENSPRQSPAPAGMASLSHFGALILAPASRDKTEWVPLGRVDEVNRAVAAYQKLLRTKNSSDSEAAAVLKHLYELVWLPIDRKLPGGTRHLIVSPDGSIERVSFGSLWTGSNFLAENYSVCYVGSARAITRKASPRPAARTAAIISNPDYGTSHGLAAKNGAARSSFDNELAGLSFQALKATENEGLIISNLATAAGLKVEALSGKQATEEAINRLERPTVLHFATHGYWLRDPLEPGLPLPKGASVSFNGTPEQALGAEMMVFGKDTQWMLKSWILLGGCNGTLDTWQQGKLPELRTDGILTAGEMGQLNLQGTWLACLSACESGLGEDAISEGVFGFRRSAAMAGAQHILLSLWPVNDQATTEFMAEFYREAFASQKPVEALNKVQKRKLNEWREDPDYGIFQAMKQAGPFVMNASALREP